MGIKAPPQSHRLKGEAESAPVRERRHAGGTEGACVLTYRGHPTKQIGQLVVYLWIPRHLHLPSAVKFIFEGHVLREQFILVPFLWVCSSHRPAHTVFQAFHISCPICSWVSPP